MSDILERLKVANANNPSTLAAQAIAEIERLRAENADLQAMTDKLLAEMKAVCGPLWEAANKRGIEPASGQDIVTLVLCLLERTEQHYADLREAVRMMGAAIRAREEAMRIETEWGNGRKITDMEVDAAWVRAESARAACDANPIARAAIDAAGGGE